MAQQQPRFSQPQWSAGQQHSRVGRGWRTNRLQVCLKEKLAQFLGHG